MPLITSRPSLLSSLRLCDAAASRLLLCRFLSAAAGQRNSTAEPHFMVEHLVASWGFSPSQAAKVSKSLTHVNSPDKPDAVLRFLEGLGLDRRQIRAFVSWQPSVLVSVVEKTLKPKVKIIRDLGFTGHEVSQIISAIPFTLRLNNIAPKIEFLRSQLPLTEDLLTALRRDPTLLHGNWAETILPNFALLRDCGVPEERLARALVGMPWLLSRKAVSFKELVEQTIAFGFDCSSPMFLYALHAMTRISKKTLEAKQQLMKSYGWSDDDFLSAFRRAPSFLTRSMEFLQAAMNFLLQEVGCTADYVAMHPMLLTMSLQGRLVPRYRVLQILKCKGLPGGEKTLLSLIFIPREKFYMVYVAPHIAKVPALLEIYQSASTEKFQSEDASVQDS